jgi:glycerol-3-phosphate acyltransferase PlsY
MESISQTYVLTAIIAYLAGSIPFGLILVNITGAGNLREIGSGNIGATNVLRTGHKNIAIATLILDCSKGWLTVIVAQSHGLDLAIISGVCTVVGHIFPIWLKFRGGKGVATVLGVLLAIAWQVGLIAIATWLIIAAIFRYSSLAAILALTLSTVYAWYLPDTNVSIMTTLIAGLSILRHKENMWRLIKGKESKIKLGKKSESETTSNGQKK